ncbi:lipoate--protein ligase family protein [Singulisphaera rosea]
MHYLDLTYPEIDRNLALDEALLLAAEERGTGGILRIWEPQDLAVVLGASGRLTQDVHVDRCRQDGLAIARRSSGGGTVVIGPGTLNVTVVLPSDFGPGLWAVDVAQRYVLERFAESLRACGPPVEVLGHGDLTIDRRKFSGSAQRRLRHHFLVHATILYDFPLDVIPRYTAQPLRQPEYRADRSHDDFLMNLGLPRTSLVAAVQRAWNVDQESTEPVDVPEDMVRDLVAAKFADPEWIGRL